MGNWVGTSVLKNEWCGCCRFKSKDSTPHQCWFLAPLFGMCERGSPSWSSQGG